MLTASVISGCALAGALLGLLLRARLPDRHLESDSKETVRQVMGLIATLSALVLGLLVASAKGTYDTQSNEIDRIATNLVHLDRILAHYGPEANTARAQLRDTVNAGIERLWPSNPDTPADVRPTTDFARAEAFFVAIQNLKPQTDVQRQFQSQALQLGSGLSEMRMMMFIASTGSVSMPFLMVLTFWIVMLFLGFGVFARPHATVLCAFVIGAFSVGGAIFLVLELNRPFDGIMRVSHAPLKMALTQMQP